MTQRKRVMSKREVMGWLSEMIGSDSVSNGDRLKAIDIMNKMRGHYAQKGEEAAPGETNITIEVVEAPRKTEEETLKVAVVWVGAEMFDNHCHCEERSDVAIRSLSVVRWNCDIAKGKRIATPSCAMVRDDRGGLNLTATSMAPQMREFIGVTCPPQIVETQNSFVL